MVESIARQSVIIKCNMQKSVMLGNYEFYYAAGLLNNLFHLELNAQMEPEALSEAAIEQLEEVTPQSDQEKYLIHMVKNYEVLPAYDTQMKDLFAWGEQEPDLWKPKTSYHPQTNE